MIGMIGTRDFAENIGIAYGFITAWHSPESYSTSTNNSTYK